MAKGKAVPEHTYGGAGVLLLSDKARILSMRQFCDIFQALVWKYFKYVYLSILRTRNKSVCHWGCLKVLRTRFAPVSEMLQSWRCSVRSFFLYYPVHHLSFHLWWFTSNVWQSIRLPSTFKIYHPVSSVSEKPPISFPLFYPNTNIYMTLRINKPCQISDNTVKK